MFVCRIFLCHSVVVAPIEIDLFKTCLELSKNLTMQSLPLGRMRVQIVDETVQK